MIGQTVSHYNILEKLVGGGMGVVYRAQDLRLDRCVALKFLPPDLTRDPDAKQRFVYEAKAASALQHNNICVVHDIDQTPDGQMFISMEHIDGETLKKKIERGPLRIEEAIDIALQVAQGLTKAHEHGITHRDIKPANIMVTSDGVAKIVDFGLAKLAGGARLTRSTSTVGTAAYMSPQQAQGTETDHRTDLWSLGVVLFEMLTGHLPFRGEHEAALLYSIVNTEPEPIARWREEVPPAIETLIDLALEKDTQDRCQTAAAFASELRRIQRRSDRVAVGRQAGDTPPSHAIPETAGTSTRSRTRAIVAVMIGAVLFVAAGTWLLVTRSTPHPPVLNPELTLRPLKVQFPEIGAPAISADGNWIVFPASDERGKWGLFFMNASGANVRPVPIDTTGDRIIDVDISPDGNSLVFSRWEKQGGVNSSSLYLVPVIGGTPRRVDGGLSARWRRDGQRFGYVKHPPFAQSASGNREFWTASSEGKKPQLEFIDSTGVKSFGIIPFAWSSDGRQIIWGRSVTEGSQELFLRDLGTDSERQITRGKASIVDVWWAREDAIVYVSDKSGFSNLWMVAADGGEATKITQASLNQRSVRCSAGGERLLYLQLEASWSLHAAAVGNVRSQTLLSGESKIGHFDPSPDGTEIAWETRDEGRNRIVVSRRNGTDRREIAQSDSAIAAILWSSDGRMLAFALFPAAAVSGPNAIDSLPVYVVDPHSLEVPRLLTAGLPMTWADSATLLVFRNGCSWLCPVDGSPPKKFFKDLTLSLPVLGTTYAFYQEGQGERSNRWITRTDGTGSPRKLPRTEPGSDWAFSPDNSFITVLTESRTLFRMHFPDCRIKPLRVALPESSESPALGFRISRNGKEIFYTQQTTQFRMVIIDRLFAAE